MALREDQRSSSRIESRSSRILGGPGGGRSLAIAAASTLVVFGALVLLVRNSPGWEDVRESFFYWPEFKESFPDILEQFGTNVQLFLLAEVFILAWGLVLAVLRSLPGPVFFPLRLLSAAYTDVFRGIPTILLIFLFGFGVPGLQIAGVPSSSTRRTSPRSTGPGSSRCTRARRRRRARWG
jgi:polar amino acid transport system permease protein